MKKTAFIAAAGILFACLSCSQSASKTEMAPPTAADAARDANLKANRIISDAFSSGDTSQVDEYVAADFVDHTESGDKNRDSLKAMILGMHQASPDMKSMMIREMADSNYVISFMHWTGTSDGSMGMPKGPYDMKAMEVVRFQNGKAVEHWTYMEPSEMMKMMGPGSMKMMEPPSSGKK